MSQSIVVVTPNAQEPLKLIEALPPPWNACRIHRTTNPLGAQIQSENGEWYIDISKMSDPEGVAVDYSTNEDLDPAFRAAAPGKTFLLLSFNDYHVMRDFLMAVLSHVDANIEEFWVDNDHGVVLNGVSFLQKLRSDLAWDWRHGA